MKKLLLASMVLLGLVTLTACRQQASQGVTDTTVRVGNAAATSGPLAFVGVPFKTAMEAYFTMVNEAGGVNGRMIEYIHYDDEFNAANGLSLTQRLVEDDQIFALVGHFGTPTVGATYEYLNELGVPRIYYATGISALFEPEAEGGARASFPVQPIYDAEGEVMVARAVGNFNAERIGVIYANDDAGRGILNGIQLRASELGIPLTEVQIDPAADDLSTAAQTILAANVDVVLVAANQVPAATSIRALSLAGSTSPVITSYVNAELSWLAGVQESLANFDIYASSWNNIFEADGVTFTDSYAQYVEEISRLNPEYAGNVYAFSGWIAAAAFVEGLRRVGDDPLTWENYIDAMESAPVQLPMGVIVDYANSRRVGTQAMGFLKAAVIDGAAQFVIENSIQTIDEILE